MTGDDQPAWGPILDAARAGQMPGLSLGAGPLDLGRAFRRRLVYVATPYSREVLDERGRFCWGRSGDCADDAAHVVALLLRAQVTGVSPIVLVHALLLADRDRVIPPGEPPINPLDADLWTRWCAPLLAACDAVYVPALMGWDRSAGIWHECRTALRAGKPVFLGGRS